MENITGMTEIIEKPVINENNEIIINESLTIINCELQDNGNIKGYRSDNNKKALYVLKDNKWLYGSNIGFNNLISLKDRTESERLEIIQKSHQKARENRQQQKSLNDIAKAMLDKKVTEEQAKKMLSVDVLPDSVDINNLTIGSLMIAKGIESAFLDGSFKWAEFVRDTAGYKPKNEVAIDADITTDADRSLMEKVSKRLEKSG